MPADIAQTILDGFDLHYWLFREFSAKAREHFKDCYSDPHCHI